MMNRFAALRWFKRGTATNDISRLQGHVLTNVANDLRNLIVVVAGVVFGNDLAGDASHDGEIIGISDLICRDDRRSHATKGIRPLVPRGIG